MPMKSCRLNPVLQLVYIFLIFKGPNINSRQNLVFRHSSQPQYTKGIQLFPGSNNFFPTSLTFLYVVSGYFFSQGNTSLENDSEHPLSAPPGLIQQWKNRRLQQKQDRQQARDREEEQRMDAILSFINENGMDSVSSEDRRFLNRASARYREKRERRLR